MPRFSIRAIFGVIVCGCPPKPATQSFMSSTGMKRTLGRRPAASAPSAADPRKARRVSEAVMSRLLPFQDSGGNRDRAQLRQCVAGQPKGRPLLQGNSAERLVEADGRLVPVEHGPFHAAAVALDG